MKNAPFEYTVDPQAFDPEDKDPMESFLLGTAYSAGGAIILLGLFAAGFAVFTFFNS